MSGRRCRRCHHRRSVGFPTPGRLRSVPTPRRRPSLQCHQARLPAPHLPPSLPTGRAAQQRDPACRAIRASVRLCTDAGGPTRDGTEGVGSGRGALAGRGASSTVFAQLTLPSLSAAGRAPHAWSAGEPESERAGAEAKQHYFGGCLIYTRLCAPSPHPPGRWDPQVHASWQHTHCARSRPGAREGSGRGFGLSLPRSQSLDTHVTRVREPGRWPGMEVALLCSPPPPQLLLPWVPFLPLCVSTHTRVR